ncbi:MAG: L-threonylcarbamoyladenylate synthase [archaeon]
MDIITQEELKVNELRYMEMIREGRLFIHPTDTIYGIGCDATNEKAVSCIRSLKGRFTRPFSIIAPSKDWCLQHCDLSAYAKSWLDRLPGPYTFILNLGGEHGLAEQTNLGLPTIGLRIPDHWIVSMVEKLGRPIITTSANRTGEDYMTAIEDLDSAIKAKIAFAIYEGPKDGKPSTVIDLTSDKEKILRE